MKFMLIGDVVGRPGRNIIKRALPGLRLERGLDLVIANGENAAAGSGLTPDNYRELIAAGVDGVTLGDHIYKRREIFEVLGKETNIVKPANFPPQAPGREWMELTAANGERMAVCSLLGRVFMRPVDCPWDAADRVLKQIPDDIKIRLVDFHAEATSDKQLMGRYLDGRVTAVLGTHTHVPTADEEIFPFGTAFQCDVGMTGPHAGILGRRMDRVLETTLTFVPTSFDVAEGDLRLHGTVVDCDPETGKAISIQRVEVREADLPRLETLASGAQAKTA